MDGRTAKRNSASTRSARACCESRPATSIDRERRGRPGACPRSCFAATTRPGADDAAVVERQAARLAVSVAREARAAERKAAREADVARRFAEQATRDSASRAGGPRGVRPKDLAIDQFKLHGRLEATRTPCNLLRTDVRSPVRVRPVSSGRSASLR
jgi:hypothetical protein